jgi:hypothetical protein
MARVVPMKYGVKAGKLASGAERGKGSVVHAIDTDSDLYLQEALCGARPKIQWSERGGQTTCSKCILELGAKIKNFITANANGGCLTCRDLAKDFKDE